MIENSEALPTHGWSGYLDWAVQLSGADASGRVGPTPRLMAQGIDASGDAQYLWEAIFVRSRSVDIDTCDFFKSLCSEDEHEREHGIAFDPFEKDYNLLMRRDGDPVEAILLRRRDRGRDFDNLFEVLATGGVVTERGLTAARLGDLAEPLHRSQQVALGIIDDGIPVLHGRLRLAPEKTRLVAFWAQVLSGPGSVESGADLDQELARLADASEDEIYRRRADALYGGTTRHSLRRRGTHGAHMIDLAGGSDLAAPNDLAAVPLLAVQLPPQVFDDTSGMRLVPYLAMALRWLIYQTIKHQIAPALVVNVSLGVVAGPKDGSSFVEQMIAREIDRAATNPHRPIDVQVVLPYGNAYKDKLVARRSLAVGSEASVPLRLLPDDRTPSYVEMRLTQFGGERDPGRLEIALEAPNGPPAEPKAIPPGHHVPLHDAQGRLIAAIYHVPARMLWTAPEPAYLVVAFSPTVATFPADLTVPSGLWTIRLRNGGGAAMDCVVQVQRDDTPFPRKTGARQAYLDGNASGVTSKGTNSAYSTAISPGVHAVGGALVRGAGAIAPAGYTAEGANWSGDHPSVSAISEEAASPKGIRAAGMLSSATLRLRGSSAAAATFSRQLVLDALVRPPLPSVAAPPPASRLGQHVVTDNPVRRHRQ